MTLLLAVYAISSHAQIDGASDTSFNKIDTGYGYGVGVDSFIRAMAVQTDGKILIGGDFTNYDHISANCITRLNSDGSKDSSFKVGIGTNGKVRSIVLQSNGKILIGGDFTKYNGTSVNYIARLNNDGSLDTSFISRIGANGYIKQIAIQSDGKIIIGGGFTSYNNSTVNYLTRININGLLDTSFHSGNGFDDSVNAIKIQADGKILVGGGFISYNGKTVNYLTRLNTNGTIDASFNTGGAGPNLAVNAIGLLSNNKIVLGGYFFTYNSTTANFITRLNTNGQIDTSFNTGRGFDNYVFTLAVQADDKVIVSGNFMSYYKNVVLHSKSEMVRLKINGDLDSSLFLNQAFPVWAGSTRVAQPVSPQIVIQADGMILLGGSKNMSDISGVSYITRIAKDNGQIDKSFDAGNGAGGIVHKIAIQSDGKILAGGDFYTYNKKIVSNIIRTTSNGSIDTSFHTGIGFDASINDIAIQNDGKIIIVGDFNHYDNASFIHLIRLNPNGSIDTSFHVGTAFSILKFGNVNDVHTVAIQSDGKILIGGNFVAYNGIGVAASPLRLNADGSIDTSFHLSNGGNIYSIAIQTDGKIIIGGELIAQNTKRIIRLNSDGSRDLSFNPVGVGAGTGDQIYTIKVQNDGKIIVGGTLTSYNTNSVKNLIRLKTNGLIDTTFKSSISMTVNDLAIQNNGAILVCGSNFISRLNPDGSLDNSFNVGNGPNGTMVKSIALQPDNKKLLIGGDFTAYNRIGKNRIARIFTSSNPLNIEYGYFKVTKQNETSLIQWSTVSETNSKYFILQRSDDSKYFSDIATINAKGNSLTGNEYQFIDSKPLDGINYYRLKETDINGTVSYSKAIQIIFSKSSKIFIYPNPAKDFVRVDGNHLDLIRITDIAGKTKVIKKVNNSNTTTIDISYFIKGIYLITVKDINGSIQTEKLMVE